MLSSRFFHLIFLAMQIPSITPTTDAGLSHALLEAINNKTKPLGSLGRLEELAAQLGLIQRSTSISIAQPAILVFAGDHGVVAEGVSAYPQDVTWQMVENFLADGAAINVFARQNGCALHVVDAGVNHDFGPRSGLLDRKLAKGTRNFAAEPAMSHQQLRVVTESAREGFNQIHRTMFAASASDRDREVAARILRVLR